MTVVSLIESADASHEPAVLRSRGGATIPLRFDRWTAPPEAEEVVVLDRAVGPVIDVGCGPGRHVYELAARGILALGIDVSPHAVAFAIEREAIVLQRSVFDRLPNEGRWATALLIDGNIGIGGDPAVLLSRLRTVLADDGSILVELDPPGSPTTVEDVRVERGGIAGPWFPWGRVSIDAIDALAADVGLVRAWTHQARTWREGERWFVQLTR